MNFEQAVFEARQGKLMYSEKGNIYMQETAVNSGKVKFWAYLDMGNNCMKKHVEYLSSDDDICNVPVSITADDWEVEK